MTHKFSFSGIDGAGKTSTESAVSRSFAEEGYRVVCARSGFADIPGNERDYFARGIYGPLGRVHRFGDRHHYRALVGLSNIASAFIWGQVERYAVSRYGPDIVINNRDPHLDAIAYSSYYFPFTENWPVERKALIMSFVNSGPMADTTFYLDADPETACMRISERNAREGVRQPHMHENHEDLERIRTQFELAIEYAASRGLKVVRLDACQPQQDIIGEISDRMRFAVRSP